MFSVLTILDSDVISKFYQDGITYFNLLLCSRIFSRKRSFLNTHNINLKCKVVLPPTGHYKI